MRNLKNLDKGLRNIDFDVYFDTVNISMNITGNQYHTEMSNSRVVEIAFRNQVGQGLSFFRVKKLLQICSKHKFFYKKMLKNDEFLQKNQ